MPREEEQLVGKWGEPERGEPEVGTLAWGWEELKAGVKSDCCCPTALILTVTPVVVLLVLAVSAGRTLRRRSWRGRPRRGG